MKELLKQKGFTQIEIAKLLNTKQSIVSKWLNGKANPKIEQIIKLSEVLETPIKDLALMFNENKKRVVTQSTKQTNNSSA